MAPSPDHQLALAVIDAEIAAHDAAVKSLLETRARLTGETDLATSLHGPSCSHENFISTKTASKRFGVSYETIRRKALEYGVTTSGNGRCRRFSAAGLREAFRPK